MEHYLTLLYWAYQYFTTVVADYALPSIALFEFGFAIGYLACVDFKGLARQYRNLRVLPDNKVLVVYALRYTVSHQLTDSIILSLVSVPLFVYHPVIFQLLAAGAFRLLNQRYGFFVPADWYFYESNLLALIGLWRPAIVAPAVSREITGLAAAPLIPKVGKKLGWLYNRRALVAFLSSPSFRRQWLVSASDVTALAHFSGSAVTAWTTFRALLWAYQEWAARQADSSMYFSQKFSISTVWQ